MGCKRFHKAQRTMPNKGTLKRNGNAMRKARLYPGGEK